MCVVCDDGSACLSCGTLGIFSAGGLEGSIPLCFRERISDVRRTPPLAHGPCISLSTRPLVTGHTTLSDSNTTCSKPAREARRHGHLVTRQYQSSHSTFVNLLSRPRSSLRLLAPPRPLRRAPSRRRPPPPSSSPLTRARPLSSSASRARRTPPSELERDRRAALRGRPLERRARAVVELRVVLELERREGGVGAEQRGEGVDGGAVEVARAQVELLLRSNSFVLQ